MFLTLQLCQLTQPYGSLLFRGVSGFIWRCNPISSFVEACIILWHLGAAILQSWKGGRSATLKRLQEVSAGLLLLRGAMGRDDVGGLMQKLMTGSFLDKEDRVSAAAPETSHTAPDVEDGVELSEIENVTPPVVSRQPTLEANRQPRRNNTLPVYDPASEKSQILREAFGSNALAHKELRIDLFTAFTELTISIKLITVRGNGLFVASSVFLISGWFALQMLLLLFHRREMSEMEMVAAVRIARTVNAEIKEQAIRWNALFVAMHLPIFAYLAYLVSFHPWFPEHATGFFLILQVCAIIVGWLGYFTFTFAAIVLGSVWALLTVPSFWKVPAFLPFLVWFLWLLASFTSMRQQTCGKKSKFCIGNFTSFLEPQKSYVLCGR